MIEKDTTILKQYTTPLSRSIQEQYAISPDHYRGDVKLGLRNSDGTGVLVGVTKVGSVQGYLLQDGQRVQAAGEAVGFQSNEHFIRTFTALTGLPPKQYAKRFSQGERQ